MKMRKNESGYALVVVLLLTVFIMIAAAVFMRASLSNAKQEQRVDAQNLSYAAAEMGVDYYLSSLKIKEFDVYENVKNEVHRKYVKLKSCLTDDDCTPSTTFENIKKEAIKTYTDNLKMKLEEIKANEVKNIDGPRTTYYLNNFPTIDITEGKAVIQMEVVGTHGEISNDLSTIIQFNMPVFLEETPIEQGQVTDPGLVFEYFKPENAELSNPCSGNGHCNKGVYYTDSPVFSDNPNNQGGLVWLHNAKLDAGNNMNSMSFTLIVQSLYVKNNMNSMSGKLILIGGHQGSGKVDIGKEISVIENGTSCVNVDGYDKRDISQLQVTGSGTRLYYSSHNNQEWPNLGKRFDGSLLDFVKECSGLSYEAPYRNGSYTLKFDHTEFKVDVNY